MTIGIVILALEILIPGAVVFAIQVVRDSLRRSRLMRLPHTNQSPKLPYHNEKCEFVYLHLVLGDVQNSPTSYGCQYSSDAKKSKWLWWMISLWKFRLIGRSYDSSTETNRVKFIPGYWHPLDPSVLRSQIELSDPVDSQGTGLNTYRIDSSHICGDEWLADYSLSAEQVMFFRSKDSS